MRLAISNIAWDIDEDPKIVKLLNQYSIDAIDIAPTKYFPNPQTFNESDVAALKCWWQDKGVEITGMQSLLFGKSNLNIFSDRGNQTKILEHLQGICRIGGILEATQLVFGSPKCRDRSLLSDNEAIDAAVCFFRKLGDIAKDNGVIINLEPNPTRYGANFMTTSEETAYVVRAVNHESVKMQFDTGALVINGESAEYILRKYSSLIGHIHICEPDLVPLGDDNTDHLNVAKALNRFLPNRILSIEMVATQGEPHLYSIERSIIYAINNYLNFTNTIP